MVFLWFSLESCHGNTQTLTAINGFRRLSSLDDHGQAVFYGWLFSEDGWFSSAQTIRIWWFSYENWWFSYENWLFSYENSWFSYEYGWFSYENWWFSMSREFSDLLVGFLPTQRNFLHISPVRTWLRAPPRLRRGSIASWRSAARAEGSGCIWMLQRL